MSQLSRRQFLQNAGITLLGSTFDFTTFFNRPFAIEATAFGRILYPATVYSAPMTGAAITGQLWPDSIHTIQSYGEGWYQLNAGYVQHTAIQPMALYPVEAPVADFPCWLEVASPVAIVRQWCAPDAPFVTRIGYGGVTQAVDMLAFEHQSWYALQSSDGLHLGWSQTPHWHPAALSHHHTVTNIEINQQKHTLIAYGGRNQQLLAAPLSLGRELPPGIYSLNKRIPAGTALAASPSTSQTDHFHGAPWQLHIANIGVLTGVYWHNDFGKPVLGPEIQTSTLVARWLYQFVADHASISIF